MKLRAYTLESGITTTETSTTRTGTHLACVTCLLRVMRVILIVETGSRTLAHPATVHSIQDGRVRRGKIERASMVFMKTMGLLDPTVTFAWSAPVRILKGIGVDTNRV